MPDPVWTDQYNFSNTPEQNGFTRSPYHGGSPVVNEITTGALASRRVEMIGTDRRHGIVFETSNVPALNIVNGVTLECVASVSGEGSGGMEITLLDYVILVDVYVNHVYVNCPGLPRVETPTDSNAVDTLFRLLLKSDHSAELYRNGALIYGPQALPGYSRPYQRILWWQEGISTVTFKALRYWSGGAMPPG